MRKQIAVFMVALAAFICTADVAPAAKSDKADKTEKGGGTLAQGDKLFITNVAQMSMAEVKLSEAAADHAKSENVKTFAKQMAEDHTKANDELKKLAEDKGVQLGDDLKGAQKTKVERVSKLNGAAFDKEYLKAMVMDHTESVKLFQAESDKGKDPAVKEWASTMLPKMKEHLQMAKDAQKKL